MAQPVTGIGVMIREAHGFIEVPRLLAWTLVAVVISYGFELLLKRAEKYSFPVSFASKSYAEKIMENFPDILNIEGSERDTDIKSYYRSYGCLFREGKLLV